MRLFTAITFHEDIKSDIYKTIGRLKALSKGGSFTTKDNLHLTMNFIGETNRLQDVLQVMDQISENIKPHCFTLTVNGLGKFNRREGDIYWLGVEENQILWRLQRELVKGLKDVGFFDLDDRVYKPHLTLGRRVKLKDGFQPKEFEMGIEPLQIEVTKISLMKSERLEGKLVYTELYHIPLNDCETLKLP
jgi:2'-5' RNA ligase